MIAHFSSGICSVLYRFSLPVVLLVKVEER